MSSVQEARAKETPPVQAPVNEPVPTSPSDPMPMKETALSQKLDPADDLSLPGDEPDLIHSLSFHGKGGTLWGIHSVNLFLTLLTAGIYRFWGKVRVRNYILSQTAFKTDRFAYHGTGRELFIGFLKAFVIFGSAIGLLNAAPLLPGGPVVLLLATLVAYGIIMFFIPVAIIGARRYRLSRTSWRGIRFSFRGPLRDFTKIFLTGSLLTGLTFGLYSPIFHARKYAFLISNSYFGGLKFEFDGEKKALFGSYILAALLTLPTLGLCWFWFFAKRHRYYWSHTSLGTARFQSTVTGQGLLLLTLTNILLLIGSLGIALPWFIIRRYRFTCDHLILKGPIDLASIQQEAQEASATGEGLGGLLELDSDFGVA